MRAASAFSNDGTAWRCRYRGDDGMKRWVGLGVFCDNLISMGHHLEEVPET